MDGSAEVLQVKEGATITGKQPPNSPRRSLVNGSASQVVGAAGVEQSTAPAAAPLLPLILPCMSSGLLFVIGRDVVDVNNANLQ